MQLDWENQVGTGSQEEECVECLQDVFLEQIVARPTREKATLDLAFCNKPDLIRELKEPQEGSDHNMIKFSLQFKREKIK